MRVVSLRSLVLALSLASLPCAVSEAAAQDTAPAETAPEEPPADAPEPVEAAPIEPAPDEPAPDEPAPAASSTPPVTTTETRSQTGGSSARITRGGSTTSSSSIASAPMGRDPAAPPEVPVQEEDDGRKADFIWLEVEGGVSYVDLVAFENESFTTPAGEGSTLTYDETTGVGPMIGVGVGFRVFFLALGARATFASYGDFDIGTIGGEVQFRIPTPVVEPWIRVGAGYAWQGNASWNAPVESETTVYGWSLDAAVGLDIFLTWWLSIGAGASLNALKMTRDTDLTAECMGATDLCPEDGDALGVQGRGFAQVGLHF